MKRFLCSIFCVVLVLPALAVSVSASTSYTFYPYEPVALYGETSDFYPDADDPMYFRYDGILPEGTYNITVFGVIDGQVLKVFNDGGGIDITSDGFTGPVFTLTYADGVFLESRVHDLNVFFEDGDTFFSVSLDGMDVYAGLFTVAQFELVDDATSAVSDIIHADLFGSFLICGTLVGLALFKGNRYA